MFAAVRLMRIASLIVCLIVAASFVVFAADQTQSASSHQREVLGEGSSSGAAPKQESSVHRALDDASSALTSPFSGIVSPSSGEWATHGVKLLLALVVYGFGVGYLARAIRVRV